MTPRLEAYSSQPTSVKKDLTRTVKIKYLFITTQKIKLHTCLKKKNLSKAITKNQTHHLNFQLSNLPLHNLILR